MADFQEFLMEVFSRLSLFFLSVSAITLASKRVAKYDKDISQDKPEIVQTITWCRMIMFPLIGSIMLLVLFYFFDYIQFVLSLYSICMSGFTVYCFLFPFFEFVCGSHRHQFGSRPIQCCSIGTNCIVILTLVTSLLITVTWILTAHWILLDVIGVALACFVIQFVRLPNLKLGMIFLIFCLVSNVFLVHVFTRISSSIFSANVMVEVAVKKAKYPVAIVADSLNMLQVSQAQPFFYLPGKIVAPSSLTEDHFSMLGLGDIVLPGLLLCLAMRFDAISHTVGEIGEHGKCSRWNYFCLSMVGYNIGLIVASLMVELINYPQPALLYLVPGVLIPLILKANVQGHLRILWHGPFNDLSSSTSSGTLRLSV